MALSPETVKFLLDQIHNSTSNTFKATTNQLFEYLDGEVKDNPIYDKYNAERNKWGKWLEQESSFAGAWSLPENLSDAKSLVFDLYRRIAEQGLGLATLLFDGPKYNDCIHEMNRTLGGYLDQVLTEIVNANPEIDSTPPQKAKGSTVFIIHGHDNELKIQLQLLLKTAGVSNFVLHEQADMGRTIIEKLVQETEKAGYAIALLTPDDFSKEEKNRARQNVILELGYFLGRIGKERVRMIVRDNVEIPSDLQGILYEKYDLAGAWKMKILKEIQAVGIYVDLASAVQSF